MFRRRIVPRRDVLFWISLAAAIVAIKISFLFLDHLSLFYLGDSGVYLTSAISPRMPNDRSFTYGLFFIRPVLTIFGSLAAVVVAQSMVSAATCVLAGICMRVGFDAPPWVVAVTAVAYAFEPLALIQERLILTETVTLFVLALFVLVGLVYIRQPRWYLIALIALLGTIALSLRTSAIPVVVVATAAVVILGAPRLWKEAADRGIFLRVLVLHVVVAIGATAGFHEAYKQYFSRVTGLPPSYNAGGNFFLVASWAPIVSKADFPNERVADRVLANVKHDLGNRFSRPVQRFWKDGLVGAIKQEENGDYVRAQELAGKVARNAGRRDPMGVAALAWDTYTDFWNTRIVEWRLKSEGGLRELSDYLLTQFNERYKEDLSGHHLRSTLTKRYHISSFYWYRFLVLTPLLALFTIVIAGPNRSSSVFIAVLVCAIMVVNCALVTEAVTRYLHPIAWLTSLLLGQVLCAAHALRKGRETETPAANVCRV